MVCVFENILVLVFQEMFLFWLVFLSFVLSEE